MNPSQLDSPPLNSPLLHSTQLSSTSLGKLAAAMAKAQGQIQAAVKDSVNPFHASKYASLASCFDACRKALSENEVAIIQVPQMSGDHWMLHTKLVHSSGEWIEGAMRVRPGNMPKGGGFVETIDPQSVGSALTYARRYMLCAMVGLPQQDDDGTAASASTPAGGDGQRETPKPPAKRGRPPKAKDGEEPAVPKQSAKMALYSSLITWSKCAPEEAANVMEMVAGAVGIRTRVGPGLRIKLNEDECQKALDFVREKISSNTDYDGWLDSMAAVASEPAVDTPF